MWYIEMYLLVSFLIGIAHTVSVFKGWGALMDALFGEEEFDTVGDTLLKKKGIKKEVFGERTVHYPINSREQEMTVKVATALDEFCKNHKVLWGVIFITVGLLVDSIIWPKYLYGWVVERLTRYNEDEADSRLLKAIKSATTVNELMQVANRMYYKDVCLHLEENEAFLQKALRFENKLDQNDWAMIQHVADEESGLYQVASEHLEHSNS